LWPLKAAKWRGVLPSFSRYTHIRVYVCTLHASKNTHRPLL
jgi:hypothetical protein